jgi:alkylation response protein AidB-like acyl-CoA dehydrogenase
MMRDSVKEFMKRLWDTCLKSYADEKPNLGLLGVAVPEAYGGLGMGFVSTMLVCDYISGATLSQLLLEHIRESVLCNNFIWY